MMVISTKCGFCGKKGSIIVHKKNYEAWQNGELIQRAFPYLTPTERELLKTGICDKCWDKMF